MPTHVYRFDPSGAKKKDSCKALPPLSLLVVVLISVYCVFPELFVTVALPPTAAPTGAPTAHPMLVPTATPTSEPTPNPTSSPTTLCQSSMSNVPLDTSTIVTARDLWFSNETDATATYGHISSWNTTAVTAMTSLFDSKGAFNEDLGCWDTAAVTDMGNMFSNAILFNQSIGSWDTAAVTDMEGMFNSISGIGAFDQDIGGWNTADVTNMAMMFGMKDFNHPIGAWDTSNVKNMAGMFYGASAFNQNIGSWNTANVEFMNVMFTKATSFNAWCPHVEALCPWGKTKAQLGLGGTCPEITSCAPTLSPTSQTSQIN